VPCVPRWPNVIVACMNLRIMSRHTELEAGNTDAEQMVEPHGSSVMDFRRCMTRKVVVFLLALAITFPAPVNLTGATLRLVRVVPPSPTEIIHKWADHYGVDKDLAVRIARAESGLNCKVQNKKSSAGGLFQFINSTFLSTQKRLGKPQDISRKYDCDENAQLGIYLLSKGELQHWNASRSVWDRSSIAETDLKSESSYLIAGN
jgi:Transglycosylase SLT domain